MLYLKTFLDNIDPKVWDLVAAGAVFLVMWLWRRLLPSLYTTVTNKSPAIAQLPIVLLGALISAAPAFGKPFWDVIQQTILGAVLSAVGAQGFHAMFKALPVPYTGAQKQLDAAAPPKP
jgi:prepilin signal peptidase PulO-like enzyme (type II secretory pathway)